MQDEKDDGKRVKTENILATRNGLALVVLQTGLGLSGSLFFPFIAPLLYDLHASYTLITFRRTFVAVASLFVSWIWGSLSDVFHSYKRLIAFGFGGAISVCVPFLLFPSLVANAFFLVLALVFFSLFRTMVYPVRNAIITLMSKETSSGKNISYIYVFFYVGWGGGSLLFGYLIENGMLIMAFFLTAVLSTLFLTVFFVGFQDKHIKAEGTLEGTQKNIVSLLRNIKKPLLILAIGVLILGISRKVFFTFFKIKLYVVYERNYSLLGFVTTLSGIGGAIATIFYGKMVDDYGSFKVFAGGAFMYMSFYFLLAFSSNPLLITIPWILPVASLISIPAVDLTGKLSVEQERGSAQGVVSGTRRIAGIGTVFAGMIADTLDGTQNIEHLSLIFLGITPFPLISVMIVYFLLRRHHTKLSKKKAP